MNQTIRPRNIEGFFDGGSADDMVSGIAPTVRLSTAVAPQVSEGAPASIPRASLMYGGGQLGSADHDYVDYNDNGDNGNGGDGFTDYRRDNFDGGYDDLGDGGHVAVARPPVARAAPRQAAPTTAPPTRPLSGIFPLFEKNVFEKLGNYLQWILIATLAATIVFLLARHR